MSSLDERLGGWSGSSRTFPDTSPDRFYWLLSSHGLASSFTFAFSWSWLYIFIGVIVEIHARIIAIVPNFGGIDRGCTTGCFRGRTVRRNNRGRQLRADFRRLAFGCRHGAGAWERRVRRFLTGCKLGECFFGNGREARRITLQRVWEVCLRPWLRPYIFYFFARFLDA